MIAAALLILLAGTDTAPEPPRAPFEGLFTDWQGAARASAEAEREAQVRPPALQPVSTGTSYAPGSPALGQRVGEIVSLGDCSEGERMARAAGDFALVAAVREYCEVKAAPTR
jgi:hypothetical protein